MNRKLWQAAVALTFIGATVRTGLSLATHDVPAVNLIFAVACMVAFGALTTRGAGVARTRIYACPEPGCGIRIRTTGQDPATDREMRTLATDHARHQKAGAL